MKPLSQFPLSIIAILSAIYPMPVNAESKVDSAARAIESARNRNPALEVRVNRRTGMPSSVRGLRPAADPNVTLGASRDRSGAASKADIMRAAKAFFETSALTAAYAAKNERVTIDPVLVRDDPDIPGRSIVHVEQRIDGLKVFGSSGRVAVNASLAVTQLATTFSSVDVGTTTPDITPARALEAGRKRLSELMTARPNDKSFDRLRSSMDKAHTKTTLVIFDPALVHSKGTQPGPVRLAWLTKIDAFRLFVDAKTAEVLFFYTDQRWATPHKVYDLGKSFEFPGTKVVDDLSGDRKKPLSVDAENIYANAGRVVAYFARVFRRPSLLNLGERELLSSFVRFGDGQEAYWCNSINFICPQRNSMVLGLHVPSALDVVGHEMTHGVVIAEADLTYANESGAVNESLADIFGTLIEFHVRPGGANWVIGEHIPGFDSTSPVRSLANP